MIRHHLTLEHVALELHSLVHGLQLQQAWSQDKGCVSLIFGGDDSEVGLVVDVSQHGGCIVQKSTLRRAMRNSRDVFPVLLGQRCSVIVKQQSDRIISFIFEHHVLHVELFSGGKGNIVLCEQSVVQDALHSRAERIGASYFVDSHGIRNDLPKAHRTVLDELSSTSHHLGRYYAQEICHRAGIPSMTQSDKIDYSIQDQIDRCVRELIDECTDTKEFYILQKDREIIVALLPLQGWDVVSRHGSILEAISLTIAKRHASERLESERKRRMKALTASINRIQRTLQALEADAAADERPALYRQWADYILSQQDIHQSGGSEFVMVDPLSHERTLIPLKSDLTLLDNAKAFYAKSKASDAAARNRRKRLPLLTEMLRQLGDVQHQLETALSLESLPVIPSSSPSHDQSRDTATSRFRVFTLDDQHTLYVGRNAANNDELTMKFARQQDWWMHVRGASGSHAVLRGVTDVKIPKTVLEKAASITAYYSQARNASYVPVVYTQRKYVRKPKGANVGAVTLEREQTIMVRPELPNGVLSEEP